jgi:hypothetical protein
MDIGLEQLFVCMNSRALPASQGAGLPGIPPAPQAAAHWCVHPSSHLAPLIGEADLCARSPGTHRHGHLFTNTPFKRLGVRNGEVKNWTRPRLSRPST